MKEVLAMFLLGSIIWYMMFQPQLDEVNQYKATAIETTVHDALAEACIKGYFTQTDLDNVKNAVATDLGYPSADVSIQGTTTPVDRGGFLVLTVSVPTRLNFINLTGNSNTFTITRSATRMSEALQ